MTTLIPLSPAEVAARLKSGGARLTRGRTSRDITANKLA